MNPRLVVHTAGLSHAGLVRENNEDSFAIDAERGFFVLADGMGGHASGEIASRIAVDAILQKLTANQAEAQPRYELLLQRALVAAHQEIDSASMQTLSQRGMGSTAVVAKLSVADGQIFVGHVGDSRAYLLRGGELQRLTEDHTFYNQARLAGRLSDNPVENPPRSILSQALGASAVIAPALNHFDIQSDDRLLLCSDGLTDMLAEPEIARLLSRGSSPAEVCEALVAAALQHGGNDNVTVITIIIGQSAD